MLYSILLHLVYFISSTDAQRNAFFRKDYTYLETTEAFYKFHTIHRTWTEAKKRCILEGSTLFYPEDQTETDAVIAFWNSTQPFPHVYIGVSDLIAKGAFETTDGKPIADIFHNWSPGEPNDAHGNEDCLILTRTGFLNDDACDKKYPFICKKSLASLDWNVLCDTYDRKYEYNHDLGKCYKFHLTPLNWTDAVVACNAEESYLAVINSLEEDNFLVNLTARAPKNNIGGDYLRGVVHLGFHNRNGEGWETLKGTTIDQSGYTGWSYNQPDNSGKREYCGSMFYTGGLNDLNCEWKAFFICEHDISSLSSSFSDRFGEEA